MTPEWTEGVCGDGAVILRDGTPVTISEVLRILNEYEDHLAPLRHECGNCRFWSEMVARAIGNGPIEALCLSQTGTQASQYTTASASCEAWKSGHHGAVDSPPNYGERAIAAYDAEERTTER